MNIVSERLAASALFFVSAVLISAVSGRADSLAIAVPAIPLKASVQSTQLVGDSPYLEVIRSASSPPLASKGESEGLLFNRLHFIESLQQNPEERTVTVALREGVLFSNGRALSGEDVKYSLSRCGEQGAEALVVSVQGERRVDIQGDLAHVGNVLTHCPIFEEVSGEAFGELLGTRNFFVGLGPYFVETMKPGVRVSLSKVKDAWQNVPPGQFEIELVDDLELRAIPDGRRALTALRFGSIDLVFTDNAEALQLAKNDETLVVGSCRDHTVIFRKGLSMDCGDVRWAASLRYGVS